MSRGQVDERAGHEESLFMEDFIVYAAEDKEVFVDIDRGQVGHRQELNRTQYSSLEWIVIPLLQSTSSNLGSKYHIDIRILETELVKTYFQ